MDHCLVLFLLFSLLLFVFFSGGRSIACPVSLICWNSLFRDGRLLLHTSQTWPDGVLVLGPLAPLDWLPAGTPLCIQYIRHHLMLLQPITR